MNIECGNKQREELENAFRFNDAVLRNLVLVRKRPVTEPSPLVKAPEEREAAPRPPVADASPAAKSEPAKEESA